jgi:hypothetical protein
MMFARAIVNIVVFFALCMANRSDAQQADYPRRTNSFGITLIEVPQGCMEFNPKKMMTASSIPDYAKDEIEVLVETNVLKLK